METGKSIRVFFGVGVHILAAVAGMVLTTVSIYWLGRSDEVQQVIDVAAKGGVKVFKDRRDGSVMELTFDSN